MRTKKILKGKNYLDYYTQWKKRFENNNHPSSEYKIFRLRKRREK